MKIGFLFPGYGSHYLGMGKELYDNYRVVQEFFEEASNCLNVNFIRLCFASSEVELNKIEHAPTALFLLQTSITALLYQENVRPDIVVGHDLGTYAGLFACGGISFPDGLYLLTKYAQFYAHLINHQSVKAIEIYGLSIQELKNLCEEINTTFKQEVLSIAIFFSQHNAVISGISLAVDELIQKLNFLQATVHSYPLGGGLYSPLMKPVVVQLKMYLEKVDFVDLSVPLISTSNGCPIIQGSEIKQRFFEQLALPITWHKTMQKLKDVDILVHIGHKTELINKLEQKYSNKIIVTINKSSDIQKLKALIRSNNQPYSTRNEIDHGTI